MTWSRLLCSTYIIDLSKPFSPQALSVQSTDPVGEVWTFGAPAVDTEHIFIRSQRDLVKITR